MHRLLILALLILPAIAQAQIALTWDDPNPPGLVTSYEVERKAGTGAYAVSSTIPAGTRTAQETLPAGGAYCWRVVAVGAGVKSSPSNEVCKTVLAGPVNLQVTINGTLVIDVQPK